MVTKKRLRTALVAIMALAFVLLSPGGAMADDTGWKNPSANAGDVGGLINPTRAYDNDDPADVGDAASVGLSGQSASHRYYDYNLGIPDCAIIHGIEVRLDWWLADTTGTNTMSVELSWDGGTNWTTAKTDSTATLAEHTAILSGSTDKWGHDWTATELNNVNFRVRVTCTDAGG
jgi:hypothetical protein